MTNKPLKPNLIINPSGQGSHPAYDGYCDFPSGYKLAARTFAMNVLIAVPLSLILGLFIWLILSVLQLMDSTTYVTLLTWVYTAILLCCVAFQVAFMAGTSYRARKLAVPVRAMRAALLKYDLYHQPGFWHWDGEVLLRQLAMHGAADMLLHDLTEAQKILHRYDRKFK